VPSTTASACERSRRGQRRGLRHDLRGSLSRLLGGGGGAALARGRAGDDLRYDLEISLEDAPGTRNQAAGARLETCEPAAAPAWRQAASPRPAARAGARPGALHPGLPLRCAPCPNCHGEGRIIKHPVHRCRARGGYPRAAAERSHPAPASRTATSSAQRGGRERLRAPAGDLYVLLTSSPTRSSCATAPIHLRAAAHLPPVASRRGRVPVLDGAAKLKVPAGPARPAPRPQRQGHAHLRGRAGATRSTRSCRGADAAHRARARAAGGVSPCPRRESSPRASKFVERMKQLFGS